MLISDSLVTVFSFYGLQNYIIGDSKDQIAHAII